jgi:hypothetical protein
MRLKLVSAVALLVLMVIHVVVVVPPLWVVIAAPLLGLLFYTVRILSLPGLPNFIEIGFETIIATGVFYALFIVIVEAL